jgi:hypothetical protein
MSNTYVIQWKSTVNGRTGKGTKLFSLEDAQALVAELNHEHPEIQHEALEAETAPSSPVQEPAPSASEPSSFPSPAETPPEEDPQEPDPALSVSP